MKAITFFESEYRSPLNLIENISKTPRFYQANTANEVANHLEGGYKRILVKSPTGTGKTLISKLVALSERFRVALGVFGDRKLRVLYIANKHRLNRQATEEYQENKSVELIVQSAFSDIPEDVISHDWDVTFIDEAHHESMMSIQLLLDKLTDKPIIGFSADDTRADGLLLKFDKVVESISAKDAAERGFIEKVGINSIIDTGKNDKTDISCEILSLYHRHMGNTIIFFRTEREVRKTTKFLKKLGCSVSMLTSESNEKDMDKELERLSTGEIQFLVNCQKIGEGVDTKNVTDVFLARHFNSEQEKRQYIGRAIRPDSPCASWELSNPLINQVSSKSVVGATKYERIIYKKNGSWLEKLFSGEDHTWGKMSNLRVQPDLEKSLFSDEEISIDNTSNQIIGKNKGRLSLGSKPWTLKGQGIDINVNPSENIIKLAMASNDSNFNVLTTKRKENGIIKSKEVKVIIKKRKKFNLNIAI